MTIGSRPHRAASPAPAFAVAHRPASFLGPRARQGIGTAVLLGVLALVPVMTKDPFWLDVGIVGLIFAVAGGGWNILGGYTGQLSFGHALFFGAGAYTTAELVNHGWNVWWTILVGIAVGAALSVIVGFPVFRLRGHYFAIATLAIGVIADIVVTNNQSLGGDSGLQVELKSNGLANLQFAARDLTSYYYVMLGLFVAAGFVSWLALRGRLGAFMRAVRDDEHAAAALGISVRRVKLGAASLSGGITAAAGSFYVMYSLYTNPTQVLDLNVSVNIALVVFLGGMGTLLGPLVGGWLLIFLNDYTRDKFGGSGSGLEPVIFGVLIIIVVLFEPGGLVRLLPRLEGSVRRLGRRARRSLS